MVQQPSMPGCCSVGILYGLYAGTQIPEITAKSGHFIAIFHQNQERAFDEVCKKHTLLSAVPTRGAYQGNKQYLAICVFRKGKKS